MCGQNGPSSENLRPVSCQSLNSDTALFYFQPGHETYPHFFDENVRHILRNAVEWAAPTRQRRGMSVADKD
jgi:trehalose utilization protein